MSRPTIVFQRTYVTPATADLRKIYIRDTIVVDDTGAAVDVPLLLPKIGTAYAPVGRRVTIVKASNVPFAISLSPNDPDGISAAGSAAFPSMGGSGVPNAALLPPGAVNSVTLEATNMALVGPVGPTQPNPAGGTPTTPGAWLVVQSLPNGGATGDTLTHIFIDGNSINPLVGTLPDPDGITPGVIINGTDNRWVAMAMERPSADGHHYWREMNSAFFSWRKIMSATPVATVTSARLAYLNGADELVVISSLLEVPTLCIGQGQAVALTMGLPFTFNKYGIINVEVGVAIDPTVTRDVSYDATGRVIPWIAGTRKIGHIVDYSGVAPNGTRAVGTLISIHFYFPFTPIVP